MNIGVNLIQYIDLQGIEVFVLNILGSAIKQNPSDRFFLFVNGKSCTIFSSLMAENVVFIEVPQGKISSLRLMLLQQWWLPRACRKNAIDILWCPSVAVPLWYKRKIATVHDCADARFREESRSMFTKLYLLLVRFFVKWRSLGVATVSDFSRSEVSAVYGISLKNITVVSEGAPILPVAHDEDIVRAQKKWHINEEYFFYVGNTRPRKNIKRILDALSEIVKKHPDFQLVLAGKIDKSFFNVADYAKHIGIEHAVIETGFISDIEKVALYRGSISLIFPSLYEGFGLPVLEAQSLGVPVITSNTSSLPEVGGDGALYVDPYVPQEIADAMIKLSTNETLRNELIQKGTENVKRFSWDEAARQTMAVLHDAAKAE